MILKSTVFVLGAGASFPYGFPVADGLLQQIYACLHAETPLRMLLRNECGFADSEILNFCRRLKDSGQYSIDAFIEREPAFMRLGKAAIAIQLLPREWAFLFEDRSESDDWCRYLFARMIPPKREAFSTNRLKVITFNFDRSFEWRLARVLNATYDINEEDTRALAASVPIIHVHGELAGEPPRYTQTQGTRFDMPNGNEVLACVERIKLGSEAGHAEHLQHAQTWLNEAERIVFIGFSFNTDNLNKIDAAKATAGKTIHGTCLKMSDAAVSDAYGYFNNPRHGYLLKCSAREFFDHVNVFGR